MYLCVFVGIYMYYLVYDIIQQYITVLAGLLGSLFFLLSTKILLKKNITLIQILLTPIGSGLALLQYEIYGRQGLFMGIAVFLWTLVNGLTLNMEYRKSTHR